MRGSVHPLARPEIEIPDTRVVQKDKERKVPSQSIDRGVSSLKRWRSHPCRNQPANENGHRQGSNGEEWANGIQRGASPRTIRGITIFITSHLLNYSGAEHGCAAAFMYDRSDFKRPVIFCCSRCMSSEGYARSLYISVTIG